MNVIDQILCEIGISSFEVFVNAWQPLSTQYNLENQDLSIISKDLS